MRLPHIKPDHCDNITPLTPPVDRVATALHKINMPNISYRDMSFPDIPMDPIVDLTYFDIEPKNINNITNVYFLDYPAIVDLMDYDEFLDVLSRLDALEAGISDISDSITNIDNSINHITNTYIQDPDKGSGGGGGGGGGNSSEWDWVKVLVDVELVEDSNTGKASLTGTFMNALVQKGTSNTDGLVDFPTAEIIEDVYTNTSGSSVTVDKRKRHAIVFGSSDQGSAFITPVKYDDYLENDT